MSRRQELFRLDVTQFVRPRDAPVGLRLLAKVLSEPGLQFAWLARLQMTQEERSRPKLARLVHLINLRWTGAEFGHGCSVGGGLVAKHPLGMVIGGGSQIGERCTILHNVTLGERRPDQSSDTPDYPIIGDDCMIGNSAVLLGRIKVGSGSRIGAGAIVLNDVEQGTTVVGNPARPTTKKRNQT